jgi:hypothetical protein
MTKDELINEFYLRVCDAKVKTARDVAEVLKEFDPHHHKELANAVVEFCKSKGIMPQDDAIIKVTNLSSLCDFQKWKETVKDIVKSSESFIEKMSPSDKGEIREIQSALNLAFAEIDVIDDTSEIYTLEQHKKDCQNYDNRKDFRLKIFDELTFPKGTVSYIGARTGRGKSSALVNIAREALSLASPRKVVFLTLEMSRRQILNKIILATAYSFNPDLVGKLAYHAREVHNVFRGKACEDESYKDFSKTIIEARDKIYKAMEEGLLVLFDGRGKSERKIMSFITAYGGLDAVVLVDYVQKIAGKEGTDKDSYRRVQAISDDLQNVAAKTNAVIIAAAQFVRTGSAKNGKNGKKGKNGQDDKFDDESFRECGDLEQDAHNAIGIGWRTDKKQRFYEILKTREDNRQGDKYEIKFVGEYSYMERGGKIDNEQAETSKKGGQLDTSKINRNVKEGREV